MSARSSRLGSTPPWRRDSIRARVVLDPGLGFAKQAHHNWSLLAHLHEIDALGRPILVGASRKRFLGDGAGWS